MRRLFFSFVLFLFVLSLGCGKKDKVTAPTNVPPPPKGRPGAGTPPGKGGDAKDRPNIPPPVSP